MVFAHDTEVALAAAVALVNTAAGHGTAAADELATVSDLRAFMAQWGWTGRMPRTRSDLLEVHDLRTRLRDLWTADEDTLVGGINALLLEASALPQLVDHDDLGWHIHAVSSEAPIARRMAVEAAMALVDVVRGTETDRMRVCAGDDCDDIVIDLSKNRSRRYCDGGCGNRANVAAYRARRATP